MKREEGVDTMRRSLAEMRAALASVEKAVSLMEEAAWKWGTKLQYEGRSIQEEEAEQELNMVRKLMAVVIADMEDGVSWAEEEED